MEIGLNICIAYSGCLKAMGSFKQTKLQKMEHHHRCKE